MHCIHKQSYSTHGIATALVFRPVFLCFIIIAVPTLAQGVRRHAVSATHTRTLTHTHTHTHTHTLDHMPLHRRCAPMRHRLFCSTCMTRAACNALKRKCRYGNKADRVQNDTSPHFQLATHGILYDEVSACARTPRHPCMGVYRCMVTSTRPVTLHHSMPPRSSTFACIYAQSAASPILGYTQGSSCFCGRLAGVVRCLH